MKKYQEILIVAAYEIRLTPKYYAIFPLIITFSIESVPNA